ncbi:uncharacterized protein K452DRAFT_48201 [Aplosporella prunicola CBS 121167]|uniref:Extracellular membrane protein CFEM domain-containing protein n=1 Tax=Aplosporella prunicola CBS 121167 TaxID=1176127 RepID=A0A6A6B980_9PEZI|nr:uncharacterized protein K452DRAFT_48201 [Aplosporella prunicola CBS 121167]KAF2140556.1 hypothetical protein K452DRAFT_48201 [Aplosporella prunicola CBS 121167]
MHLNTARLLAFSLGLFAASASSASLSDFTPRVQGLTGTCMKVYNKDIDGCTGDDLSTGENCSLSCITGLIKVQGEVQASCASADVEENSIVGVFLRGAGPGIICRNVAATTLGGSSSTKTSDSSASATMRISSVTSIPTSIAFDTSSSSTASSTKSTDTTNTADSTSASSTETAISTTASGTTTFKSSSSVSSTTTDKPASTSKGSDTKTGGGSPFDIAEEGSGASAPIISAWLLGTALLLCGTLA